MGSGTGEKDKEARRAGTVGVPFLCSFLGKQKGTISLNRKSSFLIIFLFIVGKYETSTNEGIINKSYNYLKEAQDC